MSKTPPDPPPAHRDWHSGLLGAIPVAQASDPPAAGDDDLSPTWDAVPTALPVATPVGDAGDVPVATPVPMALPAAAATSEPAAEPVGSSTVADLALAPAPAPTRLACPACATESPLEADFCNDCGCYFSEEVKAAARAGAKPVIAAPVVAVIPAAGTRVHERYELGRCVSDRLGVQRFEARDHNDGGREVVLVRQVVAAPLPVEVLPEATPVPEGDEALMPALDEEVFAEFVPSTVYPATQVMPGQPPWPGVAWERRLLHLLSNPGLPEELDYFTEGEHEYVVLEVPRGTVLWDAWDDLDATADLKFGYLSQLADLLHKLHQCNAMYEGLRPDVVVIDDAGQVRLKDLADLLPLPFPPDAPVRGTLYSAPELTSGQGFADARADLYSFGAMLYALNEHRELNQRTDFDKPGDPKPYIPRYPDCHPAFGRLMTKTFRKNVESRFPTDEAGKSDPTGFVELINTLEVLRRTYDNVRLEVASWTSTGIIRTGNEDAFAVLHAAESRQDDLGEAVLIVLCDGMGGYEAGEVAAAMTIQSIRKQLAQMRPFSVAAGESPFLTDAQGHGSKEHGHAAPPVNVEEVKKAMKQALRDANRLVFQTSRAPGSKRRGMGCTAEVVYVDGRNVIVGHVGDSRTYHLHEGHLVQLTRDQTLVNRLVELGTLTEEEAETHPRRNELQQAIGGQPDVEPGVYHGKMVPGDWVVVCSDGLTNHVNAKDLAEMLGREAWSAETAARRLVNFTLIEGATDNVTVVAVRAT